MRVCPECGYVDNPLWRASAFKWGADFMKMEDFKTVNPLLAKALEESKDRFAEDKHYLYRLSKHGNVSRVSKLEYTRKSFLLHGLTESRSRKTQAIVKKLHYENLKKQKTLFETKR